MNKQFCKQCSLQFGNKVVFDMHLQLVHGENVEIKNKEKALEIDFSKSQKDVEIQKEVEGNVKFKEAEENYNTIVAYETEIDVKEELIYNFVGVSETKHEENEESCTKSDPLHVNSAQENKKTFKCEKCDYSCSLKGNLKIHAVIHETNKPFKCEICDYNCSQKGSMKRHVAAHHEGDKSFKYEMCDYICSQKSIMKQHVSSVHNKNKPYTHLYVKNVTTAVLEKVT